MVDALPRLPRRQDGRRARRTARTPRSPTAPASWASSRRTPGGRCGARCALGVIVYGVAIGAWWLVIIGVGARRAGAVRLGLRVLPRRARPLTADPRGLPRLGRAVATRRDDSRLLGVVGYAGDRLQPYASGESRMSARRAARSIARSPRLRGRGAVALLARRRADRLRRRSGAGAGRRPGARRRRLGGVRRRPRSPRPR